MRSVDALAIFFAITAVALATGLLLRSVFDRYLDEGDPRRQLVAQVLLYGGAFVIVAVTVWLRHGE